MLAKLSFNYFPVGSDFLSSFSLEGSDKINTGNSSFHFPPSDVSVGRRMMYGLNNKK